MVRKRGQASNSPKTPIIDRGEAAEETMPVSFTSLPTVDLESAISQDPAVDLATSKASSSPEMTASNDPDVRGGQKGEYLTEKDKKIPCVVMGNLGRDPTNMIKLDARQVEAEQIRSIGLSNLNLRKEALPEPKNKELLKQGGSTNFRYWYERIERNSVKHGFDVVLLWVRVVVGSAVSYLHISNDRSKITMKDVEESRKYYEVCPFGKKALEDSGQYILREVDPGLKRVILSGKSSNMTGPEALYRAITAVNPDDVTQVEVLRSDLTSLKLSEDPTINIREYFTKVQLFSQDVVNSDPDCWVHNMFSKIVANNLRGSEDFYKNHLPSQVQRMIDDFDQKHSSSKTSYDDMVTEAEAISKRYDQLVISKNWAPLRNKPKTNELSLMAKLETKVKDLEKKLSGGTNGNNNTNNNNNNRLQPKMSEDGKVKLEADKVYDLEVFKNLSKADKTYLKKLRQQAKRGKSEKSKKKKGKITNKDAPTTPEGWRMGVDADGKPTDKKEWFCSTCKWNLSHGDQHPTNKHDPNFKATRNQNRQSSMSAGSSNLSQISTPPPTSNTRAIRFEDEPEVPTMTDLVELSDDTAVNSASFLMAWYPMEQESSVFPKEEGSSED